MTSSNLPNSNPNSNPNDSTTPVTSTIAPEHSSNAQQSHQPHQANASTVNAVSTANASEVESDANTMVVFNWIGCLFTGFIVPLIIFLLKKDNPHARSHSAEALNWCITSFIAYVALFIIYMIVGVGSAMSLNLFGMLIAGILLLMMTAIGIGHLVFCIMGAVKGANGKSFRIPFNFRLIK